MSESSSTNTPKDENIELEVVSSDVNVALTSTKDTQKDSDIEDSQENDEDFQKVKKNTSNSKIIDKINNEKPYKIHVFLDEHPLLGFSIFCCLFILIFIILFGLSTTLTLIKIRTQDVPLYIYDHKTKENFDTLTAGYNDATWEKLSISYSQQSVDLGNSLKIVFTAKNKKSLLTEKVLSKIEEIENDLLSVSEYSEKCHLLYSSDGSVIGCKRPSSITHFYDPEYFVGALNESYDPYPTLNNYKNYYAKSKISNSGASINPDYTYLDDITDYWSTYGKGTIKNGSKYGHGIYNGEKMSSRFYYSQPVDGTLENTSLANVFEFLVDSDFGIVPTDPNAQAILTIFYFGIPLEGFDNPNDNKQVEKQEDDIDEWVYKHFHDKLMKARRKNKNLFDLTWKIGQLEWVYMDDILATSMLLVIGTIITIWIYMVIAMTSFCLASMGMLMIFMNFGPSVLLYRGITQFEYFGILNMLCIFIILSIGADDVFVLVDTWTQTRLLAPKVNRAKRLTYTLKHAGKVMATTSLSTIVSFIGNSTSVFPAIYTFGTFAAWLVFVNYCSVILFYPTVLILHDEYFYTSDLKYGFCVPRKNNNLCKCCYTEGSKCYNKKSEEDLKKDLKQRKIDKFLENDYYTNIKKYNKLILAVFLCIFLVFFGFALQLKADPKPPQFLPDSDPYFKYDGYIKDHFASQDAFEINNHFVFGLKGINRKNSDETMLEDIGTVKYTKFKNGSLSHFNTNEQLWLQQFCDDLLCPYNDYSCRYQNKMSKLRIKDPTNDYDINVRKCFMTEYRTWLLNDPDANPNATVIRLLYDKFNLTDCLDLNELLDCEWKIWPQNNPNCALFSFVYMWLEDSLPTTNPDFTASTTNYDYWKPFVYLKKTDSDTSEDSGDSGDSPNPACIANQAELGFFLVTLRLDFAGKDDFSDGIKLWQNWNDYINAWKNNENGDTSTDRYGVQYVNIPAGYRDLFLTDDVPYPTGAYHNFYVQDKLIQESFFGIGIAILLALVILILATGNWIIALMSTFVIVMVVTCVIGYAVMLGWKLGMIESVIFIMVVGMAVDYVVHLSEAYLSVKANSRSLRAKKMLGRIGGSILSGFSSTLLGVIWLVGSYIIAFYKFGMELAFLEVTSVSFGLIAFTAAVSAFGPEGDFGNVQKDCNYLKDCCYNVCCRTRNAVWDEEEEEYEE